MRLIFPIRTNATRLRPTRRTDRYGDHVEDWTEPIRTEYAGVLYYPSSSAATVAENIEPGVDESLDGLTLHLPYGDDTDAGDRFLVAADPTHSTWLVNGTPARWPIQERGWDVGTVVRLIKLTEV